MVDDLSGEDVTAERVEVLTLLTSVTRKLYHEYMGLNMEIRDTVTRPVLVDRSDRA